MSRPVGLETHRKLEWFRRTYLVHTQGLLKGIKNWIRYWNLYEIVVGYNFLWLLLFKQSCQTFPDSLGLFRISASSPRLPEIIFLFPQRANMTSEL